MSIPYAVLDAQGIPIDRVLWDGVSPWQPPGGCTAVPDPDNQLLVVVEEEPQPQWIEFGLKLAELPAVNQLLGSVESISRPLERMLSGGLLQAAQGDPRTFLAAWAKACELGLVSKPLAKAIADKAAEANLPANFISALSF